jgi:phosphoglycerol transferase MdoB-like AlkP superfamily enzyme
VYFVRNQRLKKWIYGILICISLLSTLFAFTNITTVIFLGRPFNYQWLYYSGFLGSNEAKTALSENLSAIIMFNLVAIIISMLIFAAVFQKSYRLLIWNLKVRNIFLVFLGLCLFGLIYKTIRTEATWTKGQSENAITSLIYSIISTNTNSSFFTARIPENEEAFDPRKSTKTESSVISAKTNSVKNILLIVLESSGAKYFDGYGANFHLSPNLNKYAANALIFDQMYAHAPATNLSLASILGSMYPYLSYKSLTQEAPEVVYPTLSSVLKTNGYRTSFFSSADLRFQNCRQFLNHREFDNIDDFSSIQCSEQFKEENFKDLNGIDDLCLADHLTSWLDKNYGKSFFSMLWTVQPHYPYFFNSKEIDFGIEDFNFNRYLNCLYHEDELVGKVMQVLEEKHLDSTTMVVVFGDHGEAFGQHGQYGHGTAIYEENLKVPLYFINPILFHGEHKGDIAAMKDLATTILSFLNLDIPNIWQGRDLLNTNSDETFFFAPWSDYLFGYRKNNMKFIFNESQNTTEIYDLEKDPNEKINLYNSVNKDDVIKVRNRVSAWAQFQDRFIKQILKNPNQ